MRLYNGQIVAPEGVVSGGVDIGNGRVVEVLPAAQAGDINLEGCYLLPGLVDMHVHPEMADGADPERLVELSNDLRRVGTAAFLFAPTSLPVDELPDALRKIAATISAVSGRSGCLGIYLEPPYVAHSMRGGFLPGAITTPEDLPITVLLDAAGGLARYVNIAPELPGAVEAIRIARKHGAAVSMGHTAAGKADLLSAVEAGAGVVCHSFNTGHIQRFKEPGVLDITVDLLGLVSDALVSEVICDGTHVDPLLVRLLYRAKGVDHVALITDSVIGGRHAREGQEIDAGLTVYTVTGGVARRPDGALTGSTLNMARAVKNFMAFTGCTIAEAARAASATPARVLGVDGDYGAIAPGKRALFCVLNEDLEPRQDLCVRVNGLE